MTAVFVVHLFAGYIRGIRSLLVIALYVFHLCIRLGLTCMLASFAILASHINSLELLPESEQIY